MPQLRCALIALVLFSEISGAQQLAAPLAVNGAGQPWPQLVTVCTTNPGGGTCGTTVTIYTSNTLATACSGTNVALNNTAAASVGAGCSNPGYADNNGNVVAFAAPGSYWCQFSGSGIIPYSRPCPASGLPANLGFNTSTGTLTVGANGLTANCVNLPGTTSGTVSLCPPAVAGTATNAWTSTNAIQITPGGAQSTTALQLGAANTGIFATGNNVVMTSSGTSVFGGAGTSFSVTNVGTMGFTTGVGTVANRTAFSETASDVMACGNGSAGDESCLFRWNSCKVTADITLPVNTATTVCTWSLPAVAKAWAWQCQIPWVISAGTGTNTLAIIANASQTPTGATNGSAEIKTSNANAATEATTAISASGATTLLTSGTITPAATFFMSSTSGTLLASGTAGTFAIQMTAAGTTATAAAKAGATCILY